MRRKLLRRLALLSTAVLLLVLALPGLALAQKGPSTAELSLAMDTMWVIIAACLVLFMQAGFAMLEVGFSRMKNVGSVVAKILVNLAIAALLFWAFGFALAFGTGNALVGTEGWFLAVPAGQVNDVYAGLSWTQVPLSAKFLFQVAFCAVSLAIVWGTMLERTKFAVYVIFAVVFAGPHLPDGGTLDLGRRLADGAGHAGLRRLDGGSPLRRHGRARWHPAARSPSRQVRRRRPAGNYSRAQHAARRSRRPDTLDRLVGLQPRLDDGRHPRHRRHRPHDEPGRGGRRPRRDGDELPVQAQRRRGDGRQRRHRGPRRHHGALRLRRAVGFDRHRLRRRHHHVRDARVRGQDRGRRPARRDRRARHGRYLGHALLRPVHHPGPRRGRRARPVLRRRPLPARHPGPRHRRRGRLRVHSPRSRSSPFSRRPSASGSSPSRSSTASTSTNTASSVIPTSSPPTTRTGTGARASPTP